MIKGFILVIKREIQEVTAVRMCIVSATAGFVTSWKFSNAEAGADCGHVTD